MMVNYAHGTVVTKDAVGQNVTKNSYGVVVVGVFFGDENLEVLKNIIRALFRQTKH
jgi:hypothetical protein